MEERHINFLDQLFEAAQIATTSKVRGEFSNWDYDFLFDDSFSGTSNYERYKEYGADTKFSHKQWKILIDIGLKLGLPDPRDNLY